MNIPKYAKGGLIDKKAGWPPLVPEGPELITLNPIGIDVDNPDKNINFYGLESMDKNDLG